MATSGSGGSAAVNVDQRLLAALKKQRAGARLTQADERAIRRYEQQQRERYGQAYIRELPKGDYLKAAGVANKVILEQAQKLDLPWLPHDKTVDAMAMLARFHALIAENPRGFYRAAKSSAVKEFFPDAEEDWQEECWKERAWELADKRLLRRRVMLDASFVAELHGRIADQLRAFGEVLGKKFGEQAQRLFRQTWEDIEADVLRLVDGLAAGDGDGSDQPA